MLQCAAKFCNILWRDEAPNFVIIYPKKTPYIQTLVNKLLAIRSSRPLSPTAHVSTSVQNISTPRSDIPAL